MEDPADLIREPFQIVVQVSQNDTIAIGQSWRLTIPFLQYTNLILIFSDSFEATVLSS
jgi:hypothetical protein